MQRAGTNGGDAGHGSEPPQKELRCSQGRSEGSGGKHCHAAAVQGDGKHLGTIAAAPGGATLPAAGQGQVLMPTWPTSSHITRDVGRAACSHLSPKEAERLRITGERLLSSQVNFCILSLALSYFTSAAAKGKSPQQTTGKAPHRQTSQREPLSLRITTSVFLKQHISHTFLLGAPFPSPPGVLGSQIWDLYNIRRAETTFPPPLEETTTLPQQEHATTRGFQERRRPNSPGLNANRESWHPTGSGRVATDPPRQSAPGRTARAAPAELGEEGLLPHPRLKATGSAPTLPRGAPV